MKRSLLAPAILLAFAGMLSASAADVTLIDGRTFREASIVSQTPRKVVIKHVGGLSGVEKTLLPAELSARYPVDEVAAREADQQAAEARVRADAFHKVEAERAARVRLEREQTVLHNAQVAALEASERLAEAEAARIANQRTEVVYEYVPFHRSYPRYVYTPGRSYDCEPRWNEKSRDHRFVHDHTTDRHARSPDFNHRDSRRDNHTHHRETVSRPRSQPAPLSPAPLERVEDNRAPRRASASVARH